MNGKQSSMYSMQRRTSDLLKKNESLTSRLPTFTVLRSSFDANIKQIGTLGQQQEADISGLRKQKEDLRMALTQKDLDISRRVVAFAKITKDPVLAKKAYYTETNLMKSSDNEFISACLVIYAAAENNLAVLSDYGVTEEILSSLKATIDEFKSVVDTPKEGYTEKKQATDQLAKLFADQATLLDNMDVLIEMLKDTQPAFYAEYQDTRKVTYHTGSITVKGMATEAATGEPLSGVTMSFALDGEVKMEKVTAAAGGFTIKSMEEGTYTVTASRLGYVTQTLTVNVLDDEMNTVEVAMVKG
jgi:hypothetical protein